MFCFVIFVLESGVKATLYLTLLDFNISLTFSKQKKTIFDV